MKTALTHLDQNAQPRMVDVSAKPVTVRTATAAATVRFPSDAWQALSEGGFATKKGPISDVARIAGTMAVKRTAEWIPFCHTLPVEGCTFSIEPQNDQQALRIECAVTTTARTGIEMEALVGVSAAALTIYDMTKSLGQCIIISDTKLISKTGGKADFQAET